MLLLASRSKESRGPEQYCTVTVQDNQTFRTVDNPYSYHRTLTFSKLLRRNINKPSPAVTVMIDGKTAIKSSVEIKIDARNFTPNLLP